MMVDGAIEPAEYRTIKSRYEELGTKLLRQKTILDLDKVDYSNKIAGSFNLLRNLDKFYNQADVTTKQKIVSLNFPEKLVFENGRVQTPRMNEVLALISVNTNKLGNKKRDNEKKFSHLSPQVHLVLSPCILRCLGFFV
jgi:site-specific DNA recombinase